MFNYLRSVAKGTVVLPKSVTPKRIASNIKDALEVKAHLDADQEELKKLDAIAPGGKQHRFIKPPWGVPMGFPDWN
jgi:glycerol 2-dehydrogenase (NADP+)